MSGNERREVLLSVGSLDRRREESAEGRHQGGEQRHEELVDVDGLNHHSGHVDRRRQPLGEGVEVGDIVGGNGTRRLVEGTVEMGNLAGIRSPFKPSSCTP